MRGQVFYLPITPRTQHINNLNNLPGTIIGGNGIRDSQKKTIFG
jgi:hypothetical protein